MFSGDVNVSDQRLASRLGTTYPGLLVYSRHTEVGGLGTEPLLAQVRAFGPTLDAGQGHPVDSWERIGRLSHEEFVRRNPAPDDPARRPWSDLDAFYRQSNVRQVLTVLGSAVAVGRSWGAGATTDSGPSAAQLDEMAQHEHESWLEHYQRNGWTWAAERDRAREEAPRPAAVGPAPRGEPRQDQGGRHPYPRPARHAGLPVLRRSLRDLAAVPPAR